MGQLEPVATEKNIMTIAEAYRYEKGLGRLGERQISGFRNLIYAGKSPYPFFKLPNTKEWIVDKRDIEEMYLRQRSAAKRKVFLDLR